MQWGIARAKRNGERIVEPEPNEIQIDIDGPIQYQFYLKQRSILDKAGVTYGWKTRESPSKNSGHVHITITLPVDLSHPKTNREYFDTMLVTDTREGRALRVGLASILCDDPHRSAFNWARVVKGNRYPIAFFEREEKDA